MSTNVDLLHVPFAKFVSMEKNMLKIISDISKLMNISADHGEYIKDLLCKSSNTISRPEFEVAMNSKSIWNKDMFEKQRNIKSNEVDEVLRGAYNFSSQLQHNDMVTSTLNKVNDDANISKDKITSLECEVESLKTDLKILATHSSTLEGKYKKLKNKVGGVETNVSKMETTTVEFQDTMISKINNISQTTQVIYQQSVSNKGSPEKDDYENIANTIMSSYSVMTPPPTINLELKEASSIVEVVDGLSVESGECLSNDNESSPLFNDIDENVVEVQQIQPSFSKSSFGVEDNIHENNQQKIASPIMVSSNVTNYPIIDIETPPVELFVREHRVKASIKIAQETSKLSILEALKNIRVLKKKKLKNDSNDIVSNDSASEINYDTDGEISNENIPKFIKTDIDVTNFVDMENRYNKSLENFKTSLTLLDHEQTAILEAHKDLENKSKDFESALFSIIDQLLNVMGNCQTGIEKQEIQYIEQSRGINKLKERHVQLNNQIMNLQPSTILNVNDPITPEIVLLQNENIKNANYMNDEDYDNKRKEEKLEWVKYFDDLLANSNSNHFNIIKTLSNDINELKSTLFSSNNDIEWIKRSLSKEKLTVSTSGNLPSNSKELQALVTNSDIYANPAILELRHELEKIKLVTNKYVKKPVISKILGNNLDSFSFDEVVDKSISKNYKQQNIAKSVIQTNKENSTDGISDDDPHLFKSSQRSTARIGTTTGSNNSNGNRGTVKSNISSNRSTTRTGSVVSNIKGIFNNQETFRVKSRDGTAGSNLREGTPLNSHSESIVEESNSHDEGSYFGESNQVKDNSSVSKSNTDIAQIEVDTSVVVNIEQRIDSTEINDIYNEKQIHHHHHRHQEDDINHQISSNQIQLISNPVQQNQIQTPSIQFQTNQIMQQTQIQISSDNQIIVDTFDTNTINSNDTVVSPRIMSAKIRSLSRSPSPDAMNDAMNVNRNKCEDNKINSINCSNNSIDPSTFNHMHVLVPSYRAESRESNSQYTQQQVNQQQQNQTQHQLPVVNNQVLIQLAQQSHETQQPRKVTSSIIKNNVNNNVNNNGNNNRNNNGNNMIARLDASIDFKKENVYNINDSNHLGENYEPMRPSSSKVREIFKRYDKKHSSISSIIDSNNKNIPSNCDITPKETLVSGPVKFVKGDINKEKLEEVSTIDLVNRIDKQELLVEIREEEIKSSQEHEELFDKTVKNLWYRNYQEEEKKIENYEGITKMLDPVSCNHNDDNTTVAYEKLSGYIIKTNSKNDLAESSLISELSQPSKVNEKSRKNNSNKNNLLLNVISKNK
jgi:hypothetical protein